jgi:hypothetical protein
MGLSYSRELQAKDNVLLLTDDRMHNKSNKRAAVSSDGKQHAPVKKKRRVVKEEEYPVKTEEDIEERVKDEDEPQDSKQASTVVKKEEEDEIGHDNCRSVERSRPSANIAKRKYSLPSLPQQNNKKSARSKPLRKEKGSLISLGEVNRSPMASSDEDEFGRGIESAVDDASDTSDSVDGIIDHDEAILDCYDAQWNNMYKRLRAFKESRGHCELFWAADRFTFILNTPH